MKYFFPVIILILLVSCSDRTETSRITADFNFAWKFAKGDFSTAIQTDFDDSAWEDVRLPHDWSINERFVNDIDPDHPELWPGGIGWYRKSFTLPAASANKITWIEFDGVYNHSEVWINGHQLGIRPYGYVPFSYDLTPFLKAEGENIMLVRVDRTSFQDSRWYSGSGIYRNVKLVTASKTHIPQWGAKISTAEISKENAEIKVEITVRNREEVQKELMLVTTIYDPDQEKVAELGSPVSIGAGDEVKVIQQMSAADPLLWSPEAPNMYMARHRLTDEGKVVDELSTPFGIRSFRNDPETGFYLNGESTPFKGVCLHHDGGAVGAAVPIGIWERRLKTLKEAGCNAIRTAHNPPSSEFLDLCDRMGFLVQDEAFDEFHNPKDKRNNYKQLEEEDVTRGYAATFEEWAEEDVKAMVRRDRNHPCIVQWSIGNEIEWTYSRYGSATGYWDGENDVNYYYDEPPYSVEKIKALFYEKAPDPYPLAETAKKLADWIREEDSTRPVTANLVIPSVSFFSGYADVLDVVGLSYRNSVYDYIHELYPEKMILGTENWGSWFEWKPVLERDFIPGIFLWTGINYLGETSSSGRRGSGSGLLDFAGFKKPRYHMYKTLWNDEAHVFMNTVQLSESDFRWDGDSSRVEYKRKDGWKYYKWGWQPFNYHWNYQSGDSCVVEVFTNQPVVELFLNGRSLGSRSLADFEDHIIKWMLPYEAGTLKAVAGSGDAGAGDGKTEYELSTSGEPASIRLSSDRQSLKADAYDLAHLLAEILDADGNPVLHEDVKMDFKIDGACRVLGTDNGTNVTRPDYTSTSLESANGKSLLILQSGFKKGNITVSVSAKGITSETIQIKVN